MQEGSLAASNAFSDVMIRLGDAVHAERVTHWVRLPPPLGPSRLQLQAADLTPGVLGRLVSRFERRCPSAPRYIQRAGFRIARTTNNRNTS
jgi:hypothetical protein